MKRYLGILVAIAFVVFAIVFASKKWTTKVLETDRELNGARIKVEYFERVGWLRSNPDERGYKEEVTTFLRWYFNQLNEHLARYGGNRQFDDYLKELDRKPEKGGTEQQRTDKKAYYEYTRQLFDLLKSGSYAPLWSASDKGMRLDVVSASAVTGGPQPQIRYRLLLWGAQRELRDEGRNLKKMVTSASFNVTWKLFDEKQLLVGEMNAPGDPSMKVDYPERFIAEFPPQMVLGHFDIDLLPSTAAKTEITFNVTSRSQSGGDVASVFTWKLDTPSEWKLGVGEEWQGAQESVRPADEVDPTGALGKSPKGKKKR